MRRITVVVFLVALGASESGAQIIRPRQRMPEPRAWASASVGFLQPWTVNDGTTGATWDFGNAVQYRVSFEMPVQNQSTLGVTATLARVPLTYSEWGIADGPAFTPSCPSGCDADANITQLFASFHAGGSAIGFHQVIELAAGGTAYSNFRERAGGVRLPPSNPDIDFSIGIGYGFGFTLAPAMQITLVQDFALTMHQRDRLAGGENALSRQFTTRLGMRFGLGAQ